MPPKKERSTSPKKVSAKKVLPKKKAAGDGSEHPPGLTIGGSFIPQRQLIRGGVLFIVAIIALCVNGAGSGYLLAKPGPTRALVHLLFFGCFMGASIWVTFIAGPVSFYNLPRHVFGQLQAKLFPRYFQFTTVCVGICLLQELPGYILTNQSALHFVSGQQTINLLLILGMLLVQLLYLEPNTTAIMHKRHAVEKKLGTGHEIGITKPSDPKIANNADLLKLSKKFGKFHGASSSLNLAVLGLGVWHLTWLGATMTKGCVLV